jgi:hydrogenase maturation protease
MKTLVLGLGNTILCDDGAGIHVAEKIRKRCPKTDVLDASAAGFRVIDEVIGYDRLILIDSIKTGKSEPGSLMKFDMQEFEKTLHHTSPHDISMFEAFNIMKEHDEKLPGEVVIYGIEVEDTQTFSEECTCKVKEAIPEIVKTIIKEQNLQ